MYLDLESRSARLFERAKAVLPGGNSRHSVAWAPHPIYAASGQGCYVTDIDGFVYIDAINNMSANIHGHRHPAIEAAVVEQLGRLVSVGLPTEKEIGLAEALSCRVPSVEQVRFTNSGTEALMFAVRAARAFTGRPMIAKIEGGYHGSYDALDLSNRPSPDAWGAADAPATVQEDEGFTSGAVVDTLILPVNRTDAARDLLKRHSNRLAAVVIDPVVSRMGFLPLNSDFLSMVRKTTEDLGALLIFDEVFSFRLGTAGAQGLFGITPDLTTFGKVIGGGFPIGAFGGRRDVMAVFDHSRGRPRVEHSGTFNAHPVSMAAGLAALELLDDPAMARLNALGDRLRSGLRDHLASLELPGLVQGSGSLAALLPHARPFSDYRGFHTGLQDAALAPHLASFHRGMLARGVMPVWPGGFILSTPMTDETIDRILEAAFAALTDIRSSWPLAA